MRIIVLLGLCSLLFSQNIDAKKKSSEENDPKVLLEKVKIIQIMKKLDMSTAQAMKFFPKLKDLQKIEDNYRSNQANALQELRNLLGRQASDLEINNAIRKYEDAYYKRIEGEKQTIEEMREVLTSRQLAKYLIFQQEFENEIRQMIKKIKEMRSTGE